MNIEAAKKLVYSWGENRHLYAYDVADVLDALATPEYPAQTTIAAKNSEVKLDIASTARMIRVYSCWDMGEDDCVRIAQALADNIEKILSVKEREVGVDEIKIEKEMDGAACAYRNYEIMTNSQNLNESEKKSMKKLTYFGFIAHALAANVEKILIVKKDQCNPS